MDPPTIETDGYSYRRLRRGCQISLFGFLILVGIMGMTIGLVGRHLLQERHTREMIEAHLSRLQGRWIGSGADLFFNGDVFVWTFRGPGGRERYGKIEIHPASSPKTIDFRATWSNGASHDEFQYELEEDRLRLVFFGATSTSMKQGWKSATGADRKFELVFEKEKSPLPR